VQAPVAPAGVFPRQAQHQRADGVHSARPARALGSGNGRVTAGDQVAMPAQHRVGAHQ
jgi:hypothetical protein